METQDGKYFKQAYQELNKSPTVHEIFMRY